MAFVPFTKDEQPTMAAFNEKFEQAIQQALADGVKIEVGSYVGTGTYGSSNPCSIAASGEIIAIIFLGYVTTANNYFWTEGWNNNYASAMLPETLATDYTRYRGFASDIDYSYGKKSSDGKTFFWYNTGDAGKQFNESDYIYYFLVVHK